MTRSYICFSSLLIAMKFCMLMDINEKKIEEKCFS